MSRTEHKAMGLEVMTQEKFTSSTIWRVGVGARDAGAIVTATEAGFPGVVFWLNAKAFCTWEGEE